MRRHSKRVSGIRKAVTIRIVHISLFRYLLSWDTYNSCNRVCFYKQNVQARGQVPADCAASFEDDAKTNAGLILRTLTFLRSTSACSLPIMRHSTIFKQVVCASLRRPRAAAVAIHVPRALNRCLTCPVVQKSAAAK